MKKDRLLHIRVTSPEYNSLEALAQQKSRTVSSIARDKLFMPSCRAEFIEQRKILRRQTLELQILCGLIKELSKERLTPQNMQALKNIQYILDIYEP